ncbi:hypothetical protein LSH36_565g02064 [Paralvinella palmiformis]|uniref:Uncharacterized protein n=1 Tax=Paralvinella palmiformis TaxID=53620 RepID=A0AAD9J652_9ANNE|nr:hypothetical protein LSH36_565g02064 [Paralvinella palmiformis]
MTKPKYSSAAGLLVMLLLSGTDQTKKVSTAAVQQVDPPGNGSVLPEPSGDELARSLDDFLTRDMLMTDITKNNCSVRTLETHLYQWVADFVQWNTKLIEYTFALDDYQYNPLTANNTRSYKMHQWSRVITSHGQTILNLAFNYGILSLMTLTFGVEKVDVVLTEMPRGCLRELSELEKVSTILDLLLRDMRYNGTYKVVEGHGSVCHRVITSNGGEARFVQRCCYQRLDHKGVECYISHPNTWLDTLDVLLACLMCVVFIFGPMAVPDWLYSTSMHNVEYSVILKEHLHKKALICRCDIGDPVPDHVESIEASHTVDLRNKKDFVRCRRLLAELPEKKLIPIRIERYDIIVNYRKLLQECKVPVGMIQSVFRSIFLCKLRNLEPFHDCCHSDMLGNSCYCVKMRYTWLCCCKRVGRMLLMVLAPTFFYIRVILYYAFEHDEAANRKAAADQLGLSIHYRYRLMQHLTPTHPIFVVAYIIYACVGVMITIFGGPKSDTRSHRAIMEAFHDLSDMTWLSSFGVAIRNLLWPFKKHGIFIGCLLGLLIWPIFLPLSAVICFVYCLPVVFISCRIIYHMFAGSQSEADKAGFESSVRRFEAERVLRGLRDRDKLRRTTKRLCHWSIDLRRGLLNVVMSFVILATMYSGTLMVAEVACYLAEIACFTMMGLIVNASKVLRYGTLIFLVIIYSYDTYNNVNKKYLKLNKALFSEIQRRIKDLERYTSLPSYLQENRGFKSCENSEQDDYEAEDDLDAEKLLGWDINDLILFVDQDDTPRIPRKLFEEVCQVPVAGSPGPVYRSLLEATGKFFIIILFLVFVFIVVMSFGDAYKISTTNQTLATLAGGFMPFIFTNLLKPAAPQIETGLVSFRSKLEEIIKNYHQVWPMHDLVFDVGSKSDSDNELSDSDDDTECDQREDATSGLLDNAMPLQPCTPEIVSASRQIPNTGPSKTGRAQGKNKKKKTDEMKKDEGDGIQKMKTNVYRKQSDIKQMIIDIKTKIENIKLEDALPDSKVDMKIFVSEQDQEWLMSSSLDSIPWYNTDYIINMGQHEGS